MNVLFPMLLMAAVVTRPVANMHARPTVESDVVSQAIYGTNVAWLDEASVWVADAIKHAIEWIKEWTIEGAKSAANTDRMEAVTRSLARVHGEGADAAMKAVEAIKQVGYTTDDAQGAVQKTDQSGQ